MRTSILLCAHVATAIQTIEVEKSVDQVIDELEIRDMNISSYHQYEGWTEEDFQKGIVPVIKEYFKGETPGSKVYTSGKPRSGGNPRSGATPKQERSSAEDQEYIKRFLQLKYAIMFLQKTKSIGRYCFYGCWCLPNGASDLGLGTGPPMDDIDRSCREFATCYNCLYNQEIGGACEEENPGRYVIRGRTDPATKQKTLYCMNAPGTCQRNRCECDRALAMKLGDYQDQWRVDYHRRRGNPPFDAEAYCKIHPPQTVQHAAISDGAVFEQADGTAKLGGDFGGDMNGYQSSAGIVPAGSVAAGALGGSAGAIGGSVGAIGGSVAVAQQQVTINRVVSSAPIYGEIVGCCGRSPEVHYFRQGQKCCGDGEIVDYNAPCGMDFL